MASPDQEISLEPQNRARPQIEIRFNLTGDKDWGYLFTSLEFKAMLNGGYAIRVKFYDPSFTLLEALLKQGYLQNARLNPWLFCHFRILSGSDGVAPVSATKTQVCYITSMEANGNNSDVGYLEFVGIDPPSWFLSKGDATGEVWTGNISSVIGQVINKYAFPIELEICSTIDFKRNKWWMMRMDPKSFIMSLLSWSTSLTQYKTAWQIAADGYNLQISEQAQLLSKQRAFYRFWETSGTDSYTTHDTIKDWAFIADNALSLMDAVLVTYGAGAIRNTYFDVKSKYTQVDDNSTSNKRIPKTTNNQAFTKPSEASVGKTAIPPIPEVYSAGELGVDYEEYVDGNARGMYLSLLNRLMRAKFTCLGHGEWDSNIGLGIDTIFVKWTTAHREAEKYWFMHGNWIVYGFHHKVTRKQWFTDLYCARTDYDATAIKVGGP